MSFRKIGVIVVAILLIGSIVSVALLQKSISSPDFCANCHVVAPYYDSYASGDLLDSLHREAGLVCVDCHSYTLSNLWEESMSNLSGDFQTPLAERELGTKALCLSCHDSYEALAETSKEVEHNPHDTHLGEIDCYFCHKIHRQPANYCLECHPQGWIPKVL